jgi:hypothetical protein
VEPHHLWTRRTYRFRTRRTIRTEGSERRRIHSLQVSLTKAEAELLADLERPKAETYVLPSLPQLQIVVERSAIKHNEGHVVAVIR